MLIQTVVFLVLTALLSPLSAASAADFSFGCDLNLSAPPPALNHPNIQTNFIGARIATFSTGNFDVTDEERLIQAKADLIYIENPSSHEATLTQEQGYYLAPTQVIWQRPIVPFDEFLASLKSDERGRFKNKLKRSEGRVRIEIAPLTLEDFAAWYTIYDQEIVSRERGRRVIERTWAEEKGRKLKRYRKLFFYDAASGELLGGVLLRKSINGDLLEAPYAAYKAEVRDLNLGILAFAETLNYGAKRGFKKLSYGMDSNLYGHHLPISLMEYKSSLGLTPAPGKDLRLVKVLNPDLLGRDYFMFTLENGALKGHHFTDRPRNLSLPEGITATVHPL